MSEASIIDLVNLWLTEREYRKLQSIRLNLSVIIRRREHRDFLTFLSSETGLNIPDGYEAFDPEIKDIINLLLTQYGLRNGTHHRRPTGHRNHNHRKPLELRESALGVRAADTGDRRFAERNRPVGVERGGSPQPA